MNNYWMWGMENDRVVTILGKSARVFADLFFFFSSRRRHTRCSRDWSSDVCSSDLVAPAVPTPLLVDKIVTLRDCHSTRACAEEVAGCAWGRAMPQASRKTPTVTRRVCNADMGASRFTFLGGRRDPCHPTLASL